MPRLIRSEKVKLITYLGLIQIFASAQVALEELSASVHSGGQTKAQYIPFGIGRKFDHDLAALVVFRHQENIRRLIAGTEPKIGAKKS